jgi:hypothetical protein
MHITREARFVDLDGRIVAGDLDSTALRHVQE